MGGQIYERIVFNGRCSNDSNNSTWAGDAEILAVAAGFGKRTDFVMVYTVPMARNFSSLVCSGVIFIFFIYKISHKFPKRCLPESFLWYLTRFNAKMLNICGIIIIFVD